jgi:ribosome-binding protein aMBF1 (putative translation factor)
MNKRTRKRLEAAGFRFGDAEDFLELSEAECRLVELRLAVSRAVRSQRKKHGVTQKQLADKLKSSQSRVAKIEAAAGEVSLDLSFRALFAAGGGVADLVREVRASGRMRADD